MKANIASELVKPNGYIRKRDLRTLVHLAKTDQEIDLAIKAIQKYYTQKDAIKDYFGTPLMRLLYIFDKTDRALELFFSQVLEFFILSHSRSFILFQRMRHFSKV